jgi:hypothetical protein
VRDGVGGRERAPLHALNDDDIEDRRAAAHERPDEANAASP